MLSWHFGGDEPQPALPHQDGFFVSFSKTLLGSYLMINYQKGLYYTFCL